MTAPEPYKDPPPYRRRRRIYQQGPHIYATDQTQAETETEFGFGAGLVALRNNGKSPAEGGIYMGRSPRVDPPPSGVGRPRQHKRPRGEARGYPGDQP